MTDGLMKHKASGPNRRIVITAGTQLAAPAVAVSSRRRLLHLHVLRQARRRRDPRAILPHALEMKLDGLADFRLHLLQRIPDRHTAGQIGDVGGEIFSPFSITTA